ncbi:MAG: Ca2+-binding RTX toxin-like protein, partial [Pirellulaceae bacterium]
ELYVYGSRDDDFVKLDRGSGGLSSGQITVAQFDFGHPLADLIRHENVERVTINTQTGNDSVYSDDNAVQTIINLGPGSDSLIVGTVPQILDVDNRTFEFPLGVPIADRDNMTNGNSSQMIVYGDDGDDEFEVNHNTAELFLSGGADDDTFILKTFIALPSATADSQRFANLTSVFGGGGNNRYEYVQNAPVFISGGSGSDTIVVTGTPIGDKFVITDTSVVGAGRVTNFTQIEILEVNTGGGADEIYVLSTDADVEVIVRGGSGDDTIHLGGDHPVIFFDPPPLSYQPPPFVVQAPPEIEYTPKTFDLAAVSHRVGWHPPISFAVSEAKSAIDLRIFALRLSNPYFILDSTVNELLAASSPYSHHTYTGSWPFRNDVADISFNIPPIHYRIGRELAPVETTITPPQITIDPPPFAFKVDRIYDISGIQGRVTIDGGNSQDGDNLIVHNQDGRLQSDGSATPGSLAEVTVDVSERVRSQVFVNSSGQELKIDLVADDFDGEALAYQPPAGYSAKLQPGTEALYETEIDGNGKGRIKVDRSQPILKLDVSGNPIFSSQAPVQLTEIDSNGQPFLRVVNDEIVFAPVNVPIYVSRFVPVSVDHDGNPATDNIPLQRTFNELQGLGMGAGLSLIDGTPFDGVEYENFEALEIRLDDRIKEHNSGDYSDDRFTILSTHEGLTTVLLGGGDDQVDVQDIDGETVILGGAGDDVLNISETLADSLDKINGRLVFDGDAHFQETVKPLEFDPVLHQPTLDDPTLIHVNSSPNRTFTDIDGNSIDYATQDLKPIVFKKNVPGTPGQIWVYAVELDDDGVIIKDFVQKRNEFGQLLWRNQQGVEVNSQIIEKFRDRVIFVSPPSLIQVNRSVPVQLFETSVVRETPVAGVDTVNIVSDQATNSVQGTIDTYQRLVDSFSADGIPLLHNAGDPVTYFGIEPVLDDSGSPTGATHNAGELVAQRAGDPVQYLGNEPVMRSIRFNAAAETSVVDLGANTLRLPGHDLKTGTAVTYRRETDTTDDTLLGNLSEDIEYFVIPVDSTEIQLANTAADAENGVARDLTSLGSGFHLLTQPALNVFGNPFMYQAGETQFGLLREKVVYFGDGDGHNAGDVVLHNAGDLKYYFGDEPIMGGQPKVTMQGELILTAGEPDLYPGVGPVQDIDGNQLFHYPGEPVYDASGVQQTFAGGELRRYYAGEPKLYFGGETALHRNDDPVQRLRTFQRISGLGMLGGQIDFADLDSLHLRLGSGSDELQIIDVTSVNDLTIDTGLGDDSIHVANNALAVGVNSNVQIDAAGGGQDLIEVYNANLATGTTAWNITQTGTGTVDSLEGNSTVRLFSYQGFESFIGGETLHDRFVIADGVQLSGSIDGRGGGGLDTIDFSRFTSPVSLNREALSIGGAAFENIELAIGSSTNNDTLIGESLPNTWHVTSQNAGSVVSIGGDAKLDFIGFENLTGGDQADLFVINHLQGVDGAIDGAGHADDYLEYGTTHTVGLTNHIPWSTSVEVALAIGPATGSATGSGSVTNVEHVTGSSAGDRITGSSADNILLGGTGDDIINGLAGNDFIVGDFGNDTLDGGSGNDVLFGGLAVGNRENYDDVTDYELPPQYLTTEALHSSNPANFGRAPSLADRFDPNNLSANADRYVPPIITPVVVEGISIDGPSNGADDGTDVLSGGDGQDHLFGGNNVDELYGGADADYLDAGAGDDLIVVGGSGEDVILGGAGHDILDGGPDIDQLYGAAGNDIIYAGFGGLQAGQRLFGGAGDDQLFAAGPSTPPAAAPPHVSLIGDQLFGGENDDTLQGNLLGDLLVGDTGNDYLHGDYVLGSNYAVNFNADTVGGNDILLAGSGEDNLFGGGGDDELWGGTGRDVLEGQEGSDQQYGGLGRDVFILPTKLGADQHLDTGEDAIHGNVPGSNGPSNELDTLIIDGTERDDVILLSQTLPVLGQQPRVRIDYYELGQPVEIMYVDLLDDQGDFLIEQIRVAGLGGNDVIGFVTADTVLPTGVFNPVKPNNGNAESVALDLTQLSDRSRHMVGVFSGNSGNDILIGSAGRDQLDGGRGSDVLYGFGGDDRLLGDNGEGSSGDHDVLFAGQGNDDLRGGQGRNNLFAWSLAPEIALVPTPGVSFSAGNVAQFIDDGPSQDFGVFVSDTGQLFQTDGDANDDGILDIDTAKPADDQHGPYKQEATGLNRILGSIGNDNLFGGTTLDFMYGKSGNDVMFRSNGTTFESLDGGQAGDEWKEYAKESDQVWYVGGTNAEDDIRVDFVTEPGLLTDHHLITRLTDNNGNFSFAAQVRLDFSAADEDGNPLWNPTDDLDNLDAVLAETDPRKRSEALAAVEQAEQQVVDNLLPPEGEFLVILIDALEGNDRITVGPTVQKTVWIDAGPGDDIVKIHAENAILVDKAERSTGSSGKSSRNDTASQAYELSIPNNGAVFSGLTIDNPEDFDWFSLSLESVASRQLEVTTESPIDTVTLSIYPLARQTDENVAPIKTITGAQSALLNLAGLVDGETYLLEVKTDKTPTIYQLEFDPGTVHDTIDLSLRRDAAERRDVILGGSGNDVLQGGAGEDWIFGGPGNDVLSGGLDRQAGDLLIGGSGHDTFQIIPDFLPASGVPSISDELDGGSGTDRVLYLGGERDRRGFEVPDYASLRYDTIFHRYEFTSLVWDIGTQQFSTSVDDNGNASFDRQFMYYQARDVEN